VSNWISYDHHNKVFWANALVFGLVYTEPTSFGRSLFTKTKVQCQEPRRIRSLRGPQVLNFLLGAGEENRGFVFEKRAR
jgi:hypothetical protein